MVHRYAFAYQVAVNFVCDDKHIVLHANPSHTLELFGSPYAADRIMRVAKDKHLRLGTRGKFLQIVKIDGVVEVALGILGSMADKLVIQNQAFVVLNNMHERRVDRTLNDNPIAGLRERLDANVERLDGTCAERHKIAVNIPVVMACKPTANGICVCTAAIKGGVAKNAMVNGSVQGVEDGLRTAQVHICREEGDMVVGNLLDAQTLGEGLGTAPLLRIAVRVVTTIDRAIKIICNMLRRHAEPFFCSSNDMHRSTSDAPCRRKCRRQASYSR